MTLISNRVSTIVTETWYHCDDECIVPSQGTIMHSAEIQACSQLLERLDGIPWAYKRPSRLLHEGRSKSFPENLQRFQVHHIFLISLQKTLRPVFLSSATRCDPHSRRYWGSFTSHLLPHLSCFVHCFLKRDEPWQEWRVAQRDAFLYAPLFHSLKGRREHYGR